MKILGRGVVVCATAFMLGAWMPRAVPAAENHVDSRMFELTYADAKEVAENFNRTWRGQAPTNGNWGVGEIAVPFVEVNSVMVTAPEAVLETCARMIKSIDRKPKQLYVEARFVELGNSALYSLGLDWSSLTAFQGSQDAKTFSNPKVIVTSGKEAIVDMTKKRPNVVLSAKRVLNGSNNTLDVDARMMEMERARSPATAGMPLRASSRSTFATSRTVRARRNASDRRGEGYKVRERRG